MKKKIQQLRDINKELKSNPVMSEEKITYIEKILERIESYMKERFDKIERVQEKQDTRQDIIEERVVKIEKNNAVTRRELALYATIGIFVILQILDKINVI
jgi:hypothetical protein